MDSDWLDYRFDLGGLSHTKRRAMTAISFVIYSNKVIKAQPLLYLTTNVLPKFRLSELFTCRVESIFYLLALLDVATTFAMSSVQTSPLGLVDAERQLLRPIQYLRSNRVCLLQE